MISSGFLKKLSNFFFKSKNNLNSEDFIIHKTMFINKYWNANKILNEIFKENILIVKRKF